MVQIDCVSLEREDKGWWINFQSNSFPFLYSLAVFRSASFISPELSSRPSIPNCCVAVSASTLPHWCGGLLSHWNLLRGFTECIADRIPTAFRVYKSDRF